MGTAILNYVIANNSSAAINVVVNSYAQNVTTHEERDTYGNGYSFTITAGGSYDSQGNAEVDHRTVHNTYGLYYVQPNEFWTITSQITINGTVVNTHTTPPFKFF